MQSKNLPYIHTIESQFPGSCNCYLITGSESILIDSGAPIALDDIRTQLYKYGIETPEHIINTHSHPDHIGNTAAFIQLGSRVLMHSSAAGKTEIAERRRWYKLYFPNQATFSIHESLHHGEHLQLGDVTLQVLHTPGHTDDSICLFDPASRMLFSGDTIMLEDFGVVNARCDWQANIAHMEQHVDILARLDPVAIAPGHGPIITTPQETFAKVKRKLAAFRKQPEKMIRHSIHHCLIPYFLRVDATSREEVISMFDGSDWFYSIKSAVKPDFLPKLINSSLDSLVLFGILEEKPEGLSLNYATFRKQLPQTSSRIA